MTVAAQAGRSLQRNFASSLVGNTVYRLAQWLLIVVIARWGHIEMVGSFALAQAISAPVFLAVGLNLRAARTTDVSRRWTAQQYHRLRLVLNVVSIAVSGIIAWIVSPTAAFVLVTLALALSKGSEAASQVGYGYFQLRERLDLVSRSLLLRSVFGPIPFAVTLISTKDLALSCLALALGWMVITILHDGPVERRLRHNDDDETRPPARDATLWTLARAAAPLGVTAGIGSVTANIPRYGVHIVLGMSSLGLFAALAYLGQIIAMVTGSLADSMLGRLARTAQAGNPRAFMRNLVLLSGFGMVVSLVVIAAAALLGAPLTRLLLGSEYVNQTVLLVLLAGAALVTFQRTLGRGLQGGRRFRDILIMDTTTAGATVIAAAVAIPAFGTVGAAATLGIGYAVGSVVGIYSVRRMVISMRKRSDFTDA